MGATWRTAEREDGEALAAFLGREEYRCVEGSETAREVWLRGNAEFSRGGLFVHHSGVARRVSSINGMVLLRRGGSCYCILPGGVPDGVDVDDADLARTLRIWGTVRGLFGERSDLCRIQRLVAADFVEERDYLLMTRRPECDGGPAGFPKAGEPSSRSFRRPPALRCAAVARDDLVIREAGWEDWRVLCTLHGEYLNEELQLPVDASRDTVGKKAGALLKFQRVLLAFKDGKPVGKANTNARGLSADQIGGVYVRPEFRGNGIAGAIVGLLADTIRACGRRCVLYVRPENTAARRVYEKLDFEVAGTYRAVYY